MSSINGLLLRPFPSTSYDANRLTRLERLEIIINNLEQCQKDVKEQIVLQALAEKQELDKSLSDKKSYKVAGSVRQPDLAAAGSKCRKDNSGKCFKPVDARVALKKRGDPLFVEQQSHAALVKEAAAKLQAYAKGTPVALEKFYKARERIKKEEEQAQAAAASLIDTPMDPNVVGLGGAGYHRANIAPVAPMAAPVATPGYDASRDPRLRR
ncbi:MAG: hypothetical protein Q9195_003364 [Heterodermia aff. obscurata]